MTKQLRDLRARMSPESRAHANSRTLMAKLPLAKLRRARQLSQEQLAAELDVRQPAIAKVEKKTDMYISTLRRFIEAMGGELEIRAYFPDGDVRINQFEELEDDTRRARS